jgi:uncharacterized protein YydD (DUF2326 family)
VGVCPNIVGVLQADKQDPVVKVDPADSQRPRGIESAFEEANAQAEKQSHPMLLAIELFINHFVATQTQFIDIIAKMDEVETEIRTDLNEPDHQSENKSPYDNSKVDYGELSKKLHSCSSDLVELEKRRDFERCLGKFLKAELSANHLSMIHDRVKLYDELSQNRDLDVQSLPRRIESQRSVVGVIFPRFGHQPPPWTALK